MISPAAKSHKLSFSGVFAPLPYSLLLLSHSHSLSLLAGCDNSAWQRWRWRRRWQLKQKLNNKSKTDLERKFVCTFLQFPVCTEQSTAHQQQQKQQRQLQCTHNALDTQGGKEEGGAPSRLQSLSFCPRCFDVSPLTRLDVGFVWLQIKSYSWLY